MVEQCWGSLMKGVVHTKRDPGIRSSEAAVLSLDEGPPSRGRYRGHHATL
jgi:hypothetical protein